MGEGRWLHLKHPIRVVSVAGDGERETFIRSVKLAPRILGRHMRAADGAAGAASAKLLVLASLAGITPRDIDAMDGEDIETIEAVYEGSVEALSRLAAAPLDDGPPIGPTPSVT